MDLLSFAYVLFVCTPPAVLQSFPELLNWTALIRVKKTTYIIYPSLFSSLFALQQIWLSLSLRICVGLSIFRIIDYVKSVSIPSFSGPFFPHSDWIRTRKTLNTDIFQLVIPRYLLDDYQLQTNFAILQFIPIPGQTSLSIGTKVFHLRLCNVGKKSKKRFRIGSELAVGISTLRQP